MNAWFWSLSVQFKLWSRYLTLQSFHRFSSFLLFYGYQDDYCHLAMSKAIWNAPPWSKIQPKTTTLFSFRLTQHLRFRTLSFVIFFRIMLSVRFKWCREAEDRALAMVSFWKACNCRKYDELVDPLLSQLAQRTPALYKIIASKEITSSLILAQLPIRRWKAGTETDT